MVVLRDLCVTGHRSFRAKTVKGGENGPFAHLPSLAATSGDGAKLQHAMGSAHFATQVAQSVASRWSLLGR
jgi:hypothetical protein